MADLKSVTKDTSAIADSKTAYELAKKATTIEQQRDIAFSCRTDTGQERL